MFQQKILPFRLTPLNKEDLHHPKMLLGRKMSRIEEVLLHKRSWLVLQISLFRKLTPQMKRGLMVFFSIWKKCAKQ